MKEKIRTFFQNEKLKGLAKKVFNRRTLIAAVVILVIASALRITFSVLFQVEGVVTKVDGSKITVVNFLNTKTIDIGTFQTSANGIQVGDRIEIMKNLSGEVMSVRDRNRGRMEESDHKYENGKRNVEGDGDRNSMRRR